MTHSPDQGPKPPALTNGHDRSALPPAAPLTVDDMLMGGLAIDAWLKVSKFGMTFGEDATIFDSIPVELHFAEVQYCFGVRYGNPAVYARTYDHVTDTKGRYWHEVLRLARDVDPEAAEFPTADVPFVVLSDLRDRRGDLLAETGNVLGHSISITGWKFFQRFLRTAQRSGIDIHVGAVRLDLGFEAQSNQKGDWGVLTFTNIQRLK
ncbi:hypothetical protein [uncultured Marivita sp.]|uniref:hypothetical protein n=1 Tax=uncultured Marivita sp. TaxID=888080 RepID=UPI00260B20D2|nr:hypothetical protein [uncultured Marivita sp.]